MIDERRVRELLHERADAISATPKDAVAAVARARRGVVMTGLVGIVVVVAFAIAAIGGIRAVQEPPIPVGPPTTTRTPAPSPEPEPRNTVNYGPVDLTLVSDRSGRAVPFGSVLADVSGAHELTVSPDRGRVAFVAHVPGATPYGIFVVDLSDPAARIRRIAPEIAMPSGGGVGTTLGGWSPDGARLVATDAAEHSIWVIDATTGEATRVLDGGSLGDATVVAPTFVPGREAIAFTAMETGTGRREDAALWTMPIGGEPSKLIDHAAFGTYSPDGSTIAYRSVHPGSPMGVGELMLADADGTRSRILRSDGVLMSGIGPPSAAVAGWSPDGSKLLVSPPGYGWPNIEGFTIVDVATGREHELGSGQSATWWDADTVLIGSYGCKEPLDC